MLPGQATKRRWLRPALSLGLTAGLIAWLLGRVDRVQLWELLAGMEPGWFVLAAALIPLQVVLSAARWRRFSVDLGLELTWPVAVKEYALSMFLNQVLPGGMAGDGVRVWRQRQGPGTVGPALRAAVVERATGQAAHLMLTGVGLLLWTSVHSVPRPSGSLELVGILLLGLALAWALPGRLPVLGPLASDARTGLSGLGRIGSHGLISALLLGTFLLGFYACATALGLDLGWAVLTAVPLVMLAMVVPLSVGGWGLREASATVVLGLLGWSAEAALALSAAYGLSVLMGTLPGALVLLGRAQSEAPA
jgi:glycosyltransferase 2 family protein